VQDSQQSSNDGFGFFLNGFGGAFAPVADGADYATDAAQGVPETRDDYSTTNIQEAGVDESDVVKNDGGTIYVLEGDTIHIVQAVPADNVQELATVDIESNGDSLYLRGDKLIALSRQYTWGWLYYDVPVDVGVAESVSEGSAGTSNGTDADEGNTTEPSAGNSTASSPGTPKSNAPDSIVGGNWNDGSQTTVTVIDVSDPANPVIEATVRFEGQLATSRLIDNRLHLVLTTTPRLIDAPATVEDMTLDEWLPDYEVETDAGVVASGDVVDWPDFYYPVEPDGYGITTVVTLDVENPTGGFESTAISADADVIYASTEALYVTDSGYNWQTFSSYDDTAVHKLAFTDTGTQYVASGMVTGRPLNQYALGEYEGYLRIATTLEQYDTLGFTRTNSVYVLGESGADADLAIVGQIENIAPGESIYAARFLGPRGFVVTFKKIDPLFTLDMSDPANPQILGELKVPGYSDHIQLMDADHLLTIGKDADDEGSFAWYQGVQLSIFDVSDMANPQLMHKEIIGVRGTESEANHNPKAFNYFPARDALAFPINVYEGNTDGGPVYGEHTFTGLYVYRVTVADGFEFLGGISSRESDESNCWWGGWWYYGFARGVFIGDAVYAATEQGVKAAMLDDVSTVVGEAPFESISAELDDCGYPVEPAVFDVTDFGIR
jgi:uncharacterized secreted protein with C-terminal beta-propeller domain